MVRSDLQVATGNWPCIRNLLLVLPCSHILLLAEPPCSHTLPSALLCNCTLPRAAPLSLGETESAAERNKSKFYFPVSDVPLDFPVGYCNSEKAPVYFAEGKMIHRQPSQME